MRTDIEKTINTKIHPMGMPTSRNKKEIQKN